MTDVKNTESRPAMRYSSEGCRAHSLDLIGEEPLLIRVDGKAYSVVMRTPGEELAHAAGFCLGEGLVDTPDDWVALGHCEDRDPNVVDIRLTAQRREQVGDLLARRGFVSQTSCGICGKQMLEELHQMLRPAAAGFTVPVERVFECIRQLSDNQRYYQTTRGSHAALLLDRRLRVAAFAEDVGRHNALDKAIGKAFMDRTLPEVRILVLSSRISYELVQKAARAHLPVMISNSRPTALAARMGQALDMTLAFPAGSELIVVCGAERILPGTGPPPAGGGRTPTGVENTH